MSACLAGCGEDKPAICSDVNSLQSSVDDLKNVDVSENGLSELRTNLDTVKSDLTTVKDGAKDQFAPEIDAVDKAVSSLTSTLSDAASSPSVTTIAPVRAAIQSLGSAISGLEDAVRSTC